MEHNNQNIINLIFDAGRGECPSRTREAITGQPIGALPEATRQGYTFAGWTDASGNTVTPETIVNTDEDMTLFAHYTKIKAEEGDKKKKKKSSYRLQKTVLIALVSVIAVLVVALIGVNYLVSIIPYTDYDGAVYKAKKVDGVYSIYDADGYELPKNEDGYYLTVLGTQLKLDATTGAIKEFAVVAVEGIEVAGTSTRILMFAQIRQANVMSITVNNSNGSKFTIYTKDITADKKQIVIKGYDEDDSPYLVSYDAEKYAYLCVAAGYPLTINKLDTARVQELGYAEYGLVAETRVDKDGNEYEYKPTTYTIVGGLKNADGTWKKDAEGNVETVEHTVIVGDPIVGGGGYYCKLAGDENKSVYIMNNDNYDMALLQPIENLITPMITYPSSLTSCFNVENFVLASCVGGNIENLNVEVAFDYIDLTMRSKTMTSSDPYITGSGYRFKYGGYRLSADVISAVLQNFYQPNIVGIKKLGVHNDPDSLKEYGLDEPAYVLSYDLQLDTNSDGKFDSSVNNYLRISKLTENDTYYVYSDLCDVIAEVSEHSLYFVEYKLLEWVNPFPIWFNLAFVRNIEIISPKINASLVLDNSKSSQKDEINSINVTYTYNGKVLDYELTRLSAGGREIVEKDGEIYNLRQFYKSLLTLTLGGHVSDGIFKLTEEEMAALRDKDDSECQLIIKLSAEDYASITNPNYHPVNNKADMVFRFYRYSDGRSYMTINGEGEFWVDASFVEKLIADTGRLEDGILIDSSSKT